MGETRLWAAIYKNALGEERVFEVGFGEDAEIVAATIENNWNGEFEDFSSDVKAHGEWKSQGYKTKPVGHSQECIERTYRKEVGLLSGTPVCRCFVCNHGEPVLPFLFRE